jgi:rubrerythrin
MFSLKDICDIAIQIEKNGEQTYRDAQAKVNDIKLKELFGWIADEEKRHAQWFRNIAGAVNIEIEHPQIEELGKNLIKDSIGGQIFSLADIELARSTTLHQVIDQSIEFEEDTIIFYEMIREFIDDKEILEQLELIIQEEQKHISNLNIALDSKLIK